MSETTGEQALKALYLVLKNLAEARVERNVHEGISIPDGGLVKLLDGELGEPEVYLGTPPSYGFLRKAEVLFEVEIRDAAQRDAAFDALKQSIVAVLGAADETLGGLIDEFRVENFEDLTEPVKGGVAIKAGQFSVVLDYLSSSQLG